MGTPYTFDTTSSKGYWGMCVSPKIDLETGRAEYRLALHMALDSLGITSVRAAESPNHSET